MKPFMYCTCFIVPFFVKLPVLKKKWPACFPLFFLLLVSRAPVPVFAQQPFSFENYTSQKGLSQNSCYAIEQDADGFMWFATQDGLNRYDGKVFKVYLPQNSNGQNLPSNFISSLLFDSTNNRLWIGTNRGVGMYEPGKDAVVNITSLYPYAHLLQGVSVKKIVSFKRNEYWIVTFSNGLINVNTVHQKISTYFNDEANKKRVSGIVMHQGKLVVALLQQLYELTPLQDSYHPQPLLPNYLFPEIKELYSPDSSLWVGTLSKGLIKVNGLFSDKPVIRMSEPEAGGINAFITDHAGNVWLGTRGKGVLLYQPSNGKTRYISHDKNNPQSLGKDFVLSLFRNRQGIIWVGLSGGGVAKFDTLHHQFYTFSNEFGNSNSLPDNMVFCVYPSANGNYYVGTQNKGLAEWDPVKGNFLPFSGSSRFGEVNNTIYQITEDNTGTIWVAGWAGLMQLNSKTKQLRYDTETSILTAKKLYAVRKLLYADSLLVAGENGLAFFSLKNRKWNPCHDSINTKNFAGRYIFEDAHGIVWICTTGEGLVRYDYRKNDFQSVSEVKKHSIYVRHLLQKGDRLWLATDNGIVIYNYVTNRVEKQITLPASNQSGVCYAIAEDVNGFLWVSTNSGLYKVNPLDFQTTHYDLDNGLSFLEFNTACVLTEKNGSMLFGGVGGITKFNPLLLKENQFSPLPIITAVHINDTALKTSVSVSKIKNIQLSYRQNFLTLYFAATNFSNQNKNSFTYRLKGLNDEWTNNGNQNFVRFTALQPGSYVFELQSSNSDGKRCNGTTQLAIVIHPPWYKTWWFRGIALLFLSAAGIFLVRRRIQTIRKEAMLRQKIAETEMAALRAQMNPHFIFNSLNSINSFIVENKTHLASDYLTKFSRLMRLILDNSKNELITLEKELETLRLYLLMEQLRFEKKFDYAVSVAPAIDTQEIKIPPMVIQPYAENAIWHGLLHQPGKGKLDILIEKTTQGIQIKIQDNGIGREKAAALKSKNSPTRKSYGMQITGERIEQLNKQNKVAITDVLDAQGLVTGTAVTISLSQPY
jgi:ligand-binding sensor domain-containing protein